MSAICPSEPSVLRAVRAGFIEEDVRAHVRECRDCEELLELAGLLDAERREAMAEVSLPPAGALWFQMKLRAAREAQVRSARTALLIQGASLAAALAIVVAVIGLPSTPDLSAITAVMLRPWTIAIVGASILFALVAPVAVWFALARGE